VIPVFGREEEVKVMKGKRRVPGKWVRGRGLEAPDTAPGASLWLRKSVYG